MALARVFSRQELQSRSGARPICDAYVNVRMQKRTVILLHFQTMMFVLDQAAIFSDITALVRKQPMMMNQFAAHCRFRRSSTTNDHAILFDKKNGGF